MIQSIRLDGSFPAQTQYGANERDKFSVTAGARGWLVASTSFGGASVFSVGSAPCAVGGRGFGELRGAACR